MPKYLVELKDGRRFQVEADRQPTPEELAPFFTPKPAIPRGQEPGYLSQLGGALDVGFRQMASGVGTTFNALTGDEQDAAQYLAQMGALQKEQEASRTAEDVALMQEFKESEEAYKQARGPLETIEALGGYLGTTARHPGAAFKQAVQSAPNALISGATGLAGYAIGGALGAGAGLETGPGAILTGIAGATAGGAISNTLMEAGPAIYDILNERTNGAAANMTADEISAYLKQNPDIMSEGLKAGAIRGTVIGAVEGLGLKGAGALMTIPERAAARAAQKTLVNAGVDIASKEAVDAALLNPALNAAVKSAATAAKQQFTPSGNVARILGGAAIETGSAGAGEIGAQYAMGQEINPTEAYMEMLGDVGLSLPSALASKTIAGTKELMLPTPEAVATETAAAPTTPAAPAEEPSMPPPPETPVARANLNATKGVPGTEISGATAEEVLNANEQITKNLQAIQAQTAQPPIQPEQAAEAPAVVEMPAPTQAGAIPLSEGAERNRAIIADAAAKMRGQLPPEVSAGLESVIPAQPTTPPEDVLIEIPDEESLLQEPQDGVEGRETAEASLSDQLLSPAPSQKEVVGTNLMKPYAAISVPDLEKLPEPDWLKRRAYLQGKLQNAQKDKDNLNKTPKNQWGDYEYNENAKINEVFSSVRAAIQDMQLARPDLEKGFAQSQGGSEAKGIRRATGEVRTTTPDERGTGGELQQQPEALSGISSQSQVTETPRQLGGNLARTGSGGGYIIGPNAQKFAADIRAQFQVDELAEKADKLKERYYSINASKGKKEADAKEQSFMQWKQAEAKATKAKADAFAELRKQNKGFTVAQLEDREPFMVAKTLEKHDLVKMATDMGYVRQGETFAFAQPITPQGTPTPATEGKVMLRGVGSERDATKPEQMTPEELTSIAKQAKEWASTPISEIKRKYQAEFGASDAYMAAYPYAAEIYQERQVALSKITDKKAQKQHASNIQSALEDRKPVSAEAVDTYGIRLPEGYIKQGELYIFQPGATGEPVQAAPTRLDVARQELEQARGVKPNWAPKAERFAQIYEGEDIRPEVAAKNGEALMSAIQNKQWTDLLHPDNKISRKVWKEWTGKALPAGLKASQKAFKDFLDAAYPSPQTTTVATNETAPPSAKGEAVASAELQPVEGSIPTVPKVSAEETVKSTEKSLEAKTPALVNRRVEQILNAGGRTMVDDLDKFLKSLSDQEFNDFVQSDFFEDPSVAIKPTDSRQAKNAKRKAATDALAQGFIPSPKAQKEANAFERAERELEQEQQKQNAQSISNLFSPKRTNPVRNQVKSADVEQAIGELQNSGEVPSAVFTWRGTSADMRRERAKYQAQFPGAVAAAEAENVEGVFENGMSFIFTDRVVVTDLDRAKAKEDGVTPAVAAAKRVLTHENMHKGFWLLPAKQQAQIMRFLREMFPAEELDELAKVYKQYADWRTNPAHEVALLDERLQKYIEETKTIPTDGVWKQFWDYIKEIWRKWTGKPKGEPTLSSMKDVVRLLRGALKNAHKARPDVTVGGDQILIYGYKPFVQTGIATRDGGIGMASISRADDSAREAAIREGVSKTNWNALSATERAKALEEFGLKSILSRYSFDAAILPVRITNKRTGEGRPASVYVAGANPAIEVRFDTRNLTDLQNADAVTAFTGIYDMSQEEVIHTAQHLNAYQKWKDSDSKQDFEDFEVNYYNSMLIDMLQASSDGLSRGDSRVANIVVSAWNLYNPNIPLYDINEIVARLVKSQTAPAFTMEIGRQLIQFNRQDFTTETGWMRFVEAMKKYLTEVLNALRTSLQMVKIGQSGDMIRSEIEQVEAIFDAFEFGGGIDTGIRYSYASESAQNSAAGQQAARSTSYTPRQLEVFFGVRKAYEQMPKQNGPSVPLSELFSKTGELVDNLTQAEFDKIVQDMYADNAALQNDQFEPNSIVILPTGAMQSLSNPALLTLDDAIQRIEGFTADNEDVDSWPDDVQRRFEESEYNSAIQDNDVLAAWELASPDVRDPKLEPLVEIARKGRQHDVEWDKVANELRAAGKYSIENVDAELAKRLPQDIIDAAQDDTSALDEWLASDEVLADAKKPFIAEVEQRIEAAIKRVEDTGRYTWSGSEFEPVEDEDVSVRYSLAASSEVAQKDSEYLAAVEAGDMEKAQRMVDEAAGGDQIIKNASTFDFQTGVRYVVNAFHGSKSQTPITVFDKSKLGSNTFAESAKKGFFFAGSKETASSKDYYIRREFEASESGEEWVRDYNKAIKALIREAVELTSVEEVNDLPFGSGEFVSEWGDISIATLLDGSISDDPEYIISSRMQFLRDELAPALEALGVDAKADIDALSASLPDSYLDTSEGQMVNAYLFLNNPMVFDDNSNEYREQSYADRIDEALENGHDSVIIKNTFDGGPLDAIFVVFDPSQIKSADPVTYDESGNVIPLSQRFQTTSPDIRYSYAQTPAQRSAVSQFKADITEAAQGLPNFADYEGRPIKDFESFPHAKLWFNAYQNAAQELLSKLEKDGMTLEDIFNKFKGDMDFRIALGLYGRDTGGPIAQTILEAQLLQRVYLAINKARTPSQRAQAQKLHDKIAAFFQQGATLRGQNLYVNNLIYQDPRTAFAFGILQAEKKMKDNGTEAVNNAMEGSLPQVKANLSNEIPKVDEQAATAAAEAEEEDSNTSLLREAEEGMDSETKSLWEATKDLFRKIAYLNRRKQQAKSAAKASLSAADFNELDSIPLDEIDKKQAEFLAQAQANLRKLLGQESATDTPSQKATRAKRKKGADVLKKRAEKGQEIDPAEKEAAEIELAENKASQIIYRFEELYRQGFKNPPEGMSKKQQKDSIIKAFRDQVRNPVSFEQFAERLANLKVGEEVAERMFLTASRERADLVRMKDFKIGKRKVEIADKQASRLIYATEERFRQGSKDLTKSTDGDSINKAFRDQVSDPVSESDFAKRLSKLNVSQDVASRLFKTAAREKLDQEAMAAYDLLEGPKAQSKIAREIARMRLGEEIPLKTPIPWLQLFSQRASTVEAYRQRVFDAIASSDVFKNISDAQKTKLADLFAESWNGQREKIINRMIDKNRDMLANQDKKKAAKALNDSRNRILEAVNLGVFDNDELVAILGDKFGIKMKFTEAEKAKLRDLAEQLQDDTLNKAKRNKLGREFLMELEAASQVPMAELMANFWVSSVLSGWNTIISIGLSFLNATGINIVGIHVARAVTAFAKGDVAGAVKAITTMFSDYARHLLSFPSAMNRAWQYLWTGDISFLESGANDPFKKVNSLKEVARYQVVADLIAKDPNAVKAVLGRFMQFMSRLLTALDGFNVMVTKAGTLHAAMLQSNITPEQIRDITLKSDLKIYKDRIVKSEFGGNYPTSLRDKAYLNSLAEAEMYADLSKLGLKVENQDYLAAESAMTLDPTGVGGHFYNLVRSFDTRIMTSTKERLKQAEADWAVKKDPWNALNYVVWNTLNFIAEQGTNITGVRFARFAGNKFNQSVSFIPLAGLLRLYEADNAKLENAQQAFRDSIWRNQIVGVVVTAIGVQLIRAISDEPDDKKRGWFINGGWNNLTPAQKKQKLSEGQREYTLGFGDKVFNYQNWLPSALLAAIGNVSDMIRYSPDEWKSKGFANQVITAGVSGVQSSLEIPALAQLGQLFANDLATKDPAEKAIGRLGQVLAGWAGGFMPRFLKDIDYMTAPDMRRYTTFYEKVASHIPVYRRYVGNDYYDILGNKIQKNAYPGSRDFGKLKDEPEYQMLGALNARGIWLTPANAEYRMVGKGRYRRRLTQEEADAYSLETGKLYKQMILRYGPRALQMPAERAKDYISDKADAMRDLALQRAMRR